jgi:hypothetical protein
MEKYIATAVTKMHSLGTVDQNHDTGLAVCTGASAQDATMAQQTKPNLAVCTESSYTLGHQAALSSWLI